MNLRKNVLARSKPAMEAEVEELTTTVIKHGDDPFPTEDDPAVIPDGHEIPHEVEPEDPDIMGTEIVSQDPVTDITQAYENVARIVEESFDEGGLSMEAAQILNLYGYHHDVPVRAAVSTESYGTMAIYETQVALESIREVIQGWWEQLKKWLAQARQHISDWAAQLVTKIADLKGKGEALKEKANNASPASGNINFPRKNVLTINGSVPNIPSAFGDLVNFAETAYQNVIEVGFDNAVNVGGVLSNFQLSGEASLKQLSDTLMTEANVPAEPYGAILKNRVTEGSIFEKLLSGDKGINAYILASDVFLGDAQLVAGIVTINRTGDPIADMRSFGKAMKFSELKILNEVSGDRWTAAGSNDENQDDSVPRISPSDVGNIADNLIKLGSVLEGSKEVLQKKKDADRVIDQAGQSVANLNINEQVPHGKELAGVLRGLVSSMSAQVQSPTMAVTMWLIQIANVVGQYATQSLAGEVKPDSQPAEAQ